jgi:hypothetical protein
MGERAVSDAYLVDNWESKFAGVGKPASAPVMPDNDGYDGNTENLDDHGRPWPRAAKGEPMCGLKPTALDWCGGSCCLVPNHGGRHECIGDERGLPGSCPA